MNISELEKKGNAYLDKHTKNAGFVIIPDGMRQDLVDMYVAGALDNINEWHYPSKGEFPKESGDFLCCFYGLTSFKVGWYDKKDQSWCFDSRIIYPKNGADNIIAWQYIVPPKEEA